MFTIHLNEETQVIEVRRNDPSNSNPIARGNFAVDKPDRTVLVQFNHIQMIPDNHQEVNQFLTEVTAHIGSIYTYLLCIRFPAIFDGRIDFDQIKNENKISDFMTLTLDHLNCYPENRPSEDYELVTDKEVILNQAEQITDMMHRTAFWAEKWTVDETKDRIKSATKAVLIVDRVKNLPCGFGRIFLVLTPQEIFGYLSDIAIDGAHQSKGLGGLVINDLVNICISQDIKQKGITGTLCLRCADQGSGAISAGKLYRKFGFEHVKDIDNRIAIFTNKEHYIKRSIE